MVAKQSVWSGQWPVWPRAARFFGVSGYSRINCFDLEHYLKWIVGFLPAVRMPRYANPLWRN
jgi:hypothetical protein